MKTPAKPLGHCHAAAVFAISLTCVLTPVFAAPPPAIEAFAGEWSGKSAFPAAGDNSAAAAPDARRYWVEGDIVRGEIISWGANMQAFHVALIPRGPRFLKILTPEGGEPEYFVGHVAEGGVLWTSVGSDRARFIERVVGEGEERRFELLVADREGDAEIWRTSTALKPESAGVTGVIGDATPEPKLIEPVVYPTPQELEFFDRVSELIEERDQARQNSTKLAGELAGAWRELGQTAPGPAAPPKADVAALEARVEEVQKWSAELEKSLTAANARADDAGQRVQSLEAEVTRLQEMNAGAAGAVEAANSQLEARVEELSRQLAEAATARAAMEQELQGARTDLIAITKARTELEQQLADAGASAETARKLQVELANAQSQHAAARSEADNLLARLTDLQNDNARLETALAAAEKAAKDPTLAAELEETRASLIRAAEETTAAHTTITDLRTQLDEATKSRDELQQKLRETESTVATSLAESEKRLAALAQVRNEAMADLTAANERNAILQKRVAELEQASHESAAELARATEKVTAVESRMSAALIENKALEKSLREARETPVESPELLARVKKAEELSAQSATALSEAEEEIASLTSKLATTSEEKAALASQLAVLQEKPAVDPAVAGQLAAAEEQLTALKEELAAARADAEKKAGDVASLNARVAQLESEANASSERRAEIERERNTATADLALAGTRAAELDQRFKELGATLEQREAQSRQVESDLSAAREHIRALEGRIAEVETRASSLQTEKGALQAKLDESLSSPDTRIEELESRLAETYSRAEARQAENDQLRSRVASLEATSQRLQQQLSGGASGAALTADVTPRAVDALRRELAESEAGRREAESRNSDLAARLAETEVRLAASTAEPRRLSVLPPAASTGAAAAPRAVAAPPSPTRSSPPATTSPVLVSSSTPASTPVATETPAAPAPGAAADGGRVQFRMPSSASASTATATPVRQRPTRPAASFTAPAAADNAVTAPARAGANPLLQQVVRSLTLNGFRRAGADSIVVLNGRPFRAGEIIDAARGLRFVRIEASAIVFAGPDGGEYRRPL